MWEQSYPSILSRRDINKDVYKVLAFFTFRSNVSNNNNNHNKDEDSIQLIAIINNIFRRNSARGCVVIDVSSVYGIISYPQGVINLSYNNNNSTGTSSNSDSYDEITGFIISKFPKVRFYVSHYSKHLFYRFNVCCEVYNSYIPDVPLWRNEHEQLDRNSVPNEIENVTSRTSNSRSVSKRATESMKHFNDENTIDDKSKAFTQAFAWLQQHLKHSNQSEYTTTNSPRRNQEEDATIAEYRNRLRRISMSKIFLPLDTVLQSLNDPRNNNIESAKTKDMSIVDQSHRGKAKKLRPPSVPGSPTGRNTSINMSQPNADMLLFGKRKSNDSELEVTLNYRPKLYNSNVDTEKIAFQSNNVVTLRLMLSLLHKALPEFCCLLAEGPTLSSASRACSIFDSTAAGTFIYPPSSPSSLRSPKSSPSWLRHNRNRSDSVDSNTSRNSSKSASSNGQSPLKMMAQNILNPLFHLNNLFTDNDGNSHNYHRMNKPEFQRPFLSFSNPPTPPCRSPLKSQCESSSLLEQEWERITMPLVLYAGTEVLLSDMSHITTQDTTFPPAIRKESHKRNTAHDDQDVNFQSQLDCRCNILIGLFRSCIGNLNLLKEEVCDPFLADTEAQLFNRSIDFDANNTLVPGENDPSFLMVPGDYRVDDNIKGWGQSTPASTIALSLMISIEQIVALLHAKCRLVNIQRILFQDIETIDFDQAATAITLLLKTVTEAITVISDDSSSAAQPIIDCFVHELKVWKYFVESCGSLEKCQFLESIVALRQWQRHLPDNGIDSRWAKWMHETYKVMRSIVPIYMDRVKTFANPLYGFDTVALWQRSSARVLESNDMDYNAMFLEFLRQQQKLGGPDMAIAIVLDANGSGTHHMERGFSLTPQSSVSPKVPAAVSHISNNENGPNNLDIGALAKWPAVYLRSTVHLPTTITGFSRSSSRVGATSQGSSLNLRISSNALSSSPKIKGKSSGILHAITSSPRMKGKSFNTPMPNSPDNTLLFDQSIFEYAPDTGTASSWPHNEWEILQLILSNQDEYCENNTNARTTNENCCNVEQTNSNVSTLSRTINWWFRSGMATTRENTEACYVQRNSNTSTQSKNDSFSDRYFIVRNTSLTYNSKSTFHIGKVNKWMSIVVIVKDEDNIGGGEGTWNTRRGGKCIEDDKIRCFINEMTLKLCIYNIALSLNRLRSIPCSNHDINLYKRALDRILLNDDSNNKNNTNHNNNNSNIIVDQHSEEDTLHFPTLVYTNIEDFFVNNKESQYNLSLIINDDDIEKFIFDIKEVFGLRTSSSSTLNHNSNSLRKGSSSSTRSRSYSFTGGAGSTLPVSVTTTTAAAATPSPRSKKNRMLLQRRQSYYQQQQQQQQQSINANRSTNDNKNNNDSTYLPSSLTHSSNNNTNTSNYYQHNNNKSKDDFDSGIWELFIGPELAPIFNE